MATSHRLGCLVGLTFIFLVRVILAQETQTFDSEASAAAAGWVANDEAQNPDRNIDLGWQNSNLAGGAAAGEAGGLTHRSGTLPVAFYADTSIGEFSFDTPLSASGKIRLINNDFDGEVHLGFFDAKRLLADPTDFGGELAFVLAEPGGGVEPNYRWGHVFAADGQNGAEGCGDPAFDLCDNENSSFVDGIPEDDVVEFSIEYDGAGTATFVIGDEPAGEFEIPEEILEDGATLTGFGLYTGTHLSSTDDRSTEIYIDDVTYSSLEGVTQLQAGDADMDLDFDQLDLVRVQVAAKYLTGQPASWGEGDWDAAPGGSPGNPPAGDGIFNQADIIRALGPGHYLTGPYAVVHANGVSGDAQTSIGYDPTTGEIFADAPAGVALTSINIDSTAGIFTADAANNLGGSFDNDADNNIFKATFGGSFGSLSFGNVAQPGLSEEFVRGDVTVVGSLAGGGDLGDVDLIYVPEPAAVTLLAVGLLSLVQVAMRRTRSCSCRE